MIKTERILSIILAVMITATMLIPMAVSAATQSPLIDTTQTGSIKIHKYEMTDVSTATSSGTGTASDSANVPDDAKPLKDVTFKITKVAEVTSTYFSPSGVSLPTPTEAKAMAAISTATARTDTDGIVTFNALPLGIYLVQETASPSHVTAKVADFVVSVPRTNVDGDGWDYNLEFFPKNETKYTNITIRKTDYASSATLQGAVFTLQQYYNGAWIDVKTGLTTGANGTVVTPDIGVNYNYRLIETTAPSTYILDRAAITYFYVNANGEACPRGTTTAFNSTTPTVVNVTNSKPAISKKIDKSTGSNTNLVTETTLGYNTAGNATYYTLEVTTPNVDMTSMSKFTVTDTIAGLYGSVRLNKITEKNGGAVVDSSQYTFNANNNVVTIAFKTGSGSTIKKNTAYYISIYGTLRANAGSSITNTATIEYSTDTSDTTKTNTINSNSTTIGVGGYQLLKVNSSDAPLSGVEFKLYASEADAKAGTNPVTAFIGANGTTTGSTFTTDSNGYLNINGIYYGDDIDGSKDYWLVETKTQEGYNLFSEPFKIVVNKNSGSYSYTGKKVVNVPKTELPHTGGSSITIYYILGGGLIAIGIFCLIILSVKKKRGKKPSA
ncbi:MAG: SpaH/EbpB family LPXTG-anchored major pilin [Ruminococcus sp.]|nr:SpaH/EbpB family LPXTG-anchored major pilin [Ruminococcus sp.]